MQGLLERRSDWLIKMEFAPHWLRSQGTDPLELLRYLVGGYQIAEYPERIVYKTSGLASLFDQPLAATELEAFLQHVISLDRDGLGWVDLIARPQRRRSPVRSLTPHLPRLCLMLGPVGECSGVESVGGDWLGRRRWSLIWAAVAVAVVGAPTSAAVATPPAVDQYTQHLPTAGDGSRPAGEKAPEAELALLPKETVSDLDGPDGQLLAQIATSPQLGAPKSTGSAEPAARAGGVTRKSGNDRGIATVVADTAGTGPSLALAGALVGIAFAGAWNRLHRRRSSTDL